VIVNHDESLLDAVHDKLWLSVLIANDPVPPEPETLAEVGLMVRTAPNWVKGMVTDDPSVPVTTIFAVRLAAVGVAAAEYWMAPSPFPEAPDVIVSHD
jgi:hypothetical protein